MTKPLCDVKEIKHLLKTKPPKVKPAKDPDIKLTYDAPLEDLVGLLEEKFKRDTPPVGRSAKYLNRGSAFTFKRKNSEASERNSSY